MKSGKQYIILGVVILACVAYLSLYKKDRTRYVLPSPPQVEREALSAVAITKGAATLRLEKRGGQWFIEPGGYQADAGKVNAMLDAMKGLTLTALISESGSYARYGLDDAVKITAKAWAGNDMVRSLDIGNAVSTYQHTFVKLSGDGNVYHARGNIRSLFDKTADDLRDKKVLSFTPSDIRHIRIAAGGTVREFTRELVTKDRERKSAEEAGQSPAGQAESSRWIDTKGSAVDGKALDRLLSLSGDLKCSTFAGGDTATAAVPLFRIEMEGKAAHTLTIFPPAESGAKDYPGRSSGSTHPFLIAASTGDELRDIANGLVGLPGKGKARVQK